jgi:hypothetical protein
VRCLRDERAQTQSRFRKPHRARLRAGPRTKQDITADEEPELARPVHVVPLFEDELDALARKLCIREILDDAVDADLAFGLAIGLLGDATALLGRPASEQ